MNRVDETRASPVTIHRMEIWISHVLRVGVIIAGTVTLIGAVLFMALGSRTGQSVSLHQILHGGSPIPVSPRQILEGVDAGKPLEIIYLGIVLLILTPVVRVAMTAAFFTSQKDWTFAVITSVVLAILILGLSGVIA